MKFRNGTGPSGEGENTGRLWGDDVRPIVLVSRSLEIGGAERQLAMMAERWTQLGEPVVVLTLYDGGPLRDAVVQSGVRVLSIGKSGRWDVVRFLWRTRGALRALNPRVVYSFLVVPNLVVLLLRSAIPGARVVLGLRASTVGGIAGDWVSTLTFRLVALLANGADAFIANSEAAARFHIAAGYAAAKMSVIPNGIDAERFVPDLQGRGRLRKELGLSMQAPVIGMVARLDPLKDHETFLRACALIGRTLPDACFIVVGGGDENIRARGEALTHRLGIGKRVFWLGARADMSAVYSTLDVHVSTSRSEGFPNVVGEAMSCGVPCVVTPAGDSVAIVDGTGAVVPFGDAGAVAAACVDLVRSKQTFPDQQSRRRIIAEYGLERVVGRTTEVLNG